MVVIIILKMNFFDIVSFQVTQLPVLQFATAIKTKGQQTMLTLREKQWSSCFPKVVKALQSK